MSNDVGLANAQLCFVCKEVTPGTLVFPTTAAEKVEVAGYAEINQQPTFEDSKEVANTHDIIARIKNQTGPGTLSIPFYIRPSGTAGTAPMADAIFESVYGKKTVTGGVSVAYSQQLTRPSCSVWIKCDHTVFFASMAVFETLTRNRKVGGGAELKADAKFKEMRWVGTDALDGLVAAAATAYVVEDSSKFCVGGYFEIVESGVVKNNTNAGYKITAIDHATKTLTADAAEEEFATGSTIRPFLPDVTAVGDILENTQSVVTLDGTTKNVKTLDINYNAPVVFEEEEITTDGFPSTYTPDTRNIGISMDIRFRQDDLAYYKAANDGTLYDLKEIIGTIAGKIATFRHQYTQLEVPSKSTTKPTISLSITGKAIGSAGEDSGSLTFT